MMKRVHIIKQWPCGGGMEQVIRFHLSRDERVVALTGCPAPGETVEVLGLQPSTPLGRCRRLLREALLKDQGSVFLHYNGYALDWLDPSQPVGQHLFYLHSDYPALPDLLRAQAGFSGGVACVGTGLATRVRGCLPQELARPVFVVDLPVRLPSWNARQAAKPRPPVIGFAGRIQRAQKRLDRLPAFLDELARRGIPCRMEILGDGPYRNRLESRLRSHGSVQFHGHLEGEDYVRTLLGWRYVLFLSDYEGLPLALLEAVAAGATPLYPDFHDGRDWSCALVPGYPAGDARAAAALLCQLEDKQSGPGREEFLEGSWNMVAKRTPENYLEQLEQAESGLAPAIADSASASSLSVPLPLWAYHRLLRFRQFGWQALLGRK